MATSIKEDLHVTRAMKYFLLFSSVTTEQTGTVLAKTLQTGDILATEFVRNSSSPVSALDDQRSLEISYVHERPREQREVVQKRLQWPGSQ